MPLRNIKISEFFSPQLGKWAVLGMLTILLFRMIFPFLPFFQLVNIIQWYTVMGIIQQLLQIIAWLCLGKWLGENFNMEVSVRFLMAFLVGSGVLLLIYLVEAIAKIPVLYGVLGFVEFFYTLMILRFALLLITDFQFPLFGVRILFASLIILFFLLPWIMKLQVIKDLFTWQIDAISFNVLYFMVEVFFFGVFAFVMHKISQYRTEESDPNFGLIDEIGTSE